MAKVLVLYYSSYGHIRTMAEAMAEGATQAGATVTIRRVAETAPEAVVKAAGFVSDHYHDVASVDELPDYDAIIIGSPTRYGRIASQMASFLDQTGGLFAKGALTGKVGGAFTSTASQHGGQETTLFSIITNLLHLGLIPVGLPYAFRDQMGVEQVKGGSPYGATTLADGDGSRQPSEIDLAGARYQGKHIAGIATKLFG